MAEEVNPEYVSPFKIPRCSNQYDNRPCMRYRCPVHDSNADSSGVDWAMYREKFAETGDTAWLMKMLDYVSAECPPDAPGKEIERPFSTLEKAKGIAVILAAVALVVVLMVCAFI